LIKFNLVNDPLFPAVSRPKLPKFGHLRDFPGAGRSPGEHDHVVSLNLKSDLELRPEHVGNADRRLGLVARKACITSGFKPPCRLLGVGARPEHILCVLVASACFDLLQELAAALTLIQMPAGRRPA
jgi:hypothetical protein